VHESTSRKLSREFLLSYSLQYVLASTNLAFDDPLSSAFSMKISKCVIGEPFAKPSSQFKTTCSLYNEQNGSTGNGLQPVVKQRSGEKPLVPQSVKA
jgi:hypothetical protein